MKSYQDRIKTKLNQLIKLKWNQPAYYQKYRNMLTRVYDDINDNDSMVDIAEFLAYRSYKSSWKNMKQRLYNRVYAMLNYNAYFITLTYKGDTPNEKEAIKHMRKWSKLNCDLFISNIDYGSKNNRIHIHSVCVPKHTLNKTWKYGAINIKKLPNNKIDARRTVLYITKLINHSIKESTGTIYKSQRKE